MKLPLILLTLFTFNTPLFSSNPQGHTLLAANAPASNKHSETSLSLNKVNSASNEAEAVKIVEFDKNIANMMRSWQQGEHMQDSTQQIKARKPRPGDFEKPKVSGKTSKRKARRAKTSG